MAIKGRSNTYGMIRNSAYVRPVHTVLPQRDLMQLAFQTIIKN